MATQHEKDKMSDLDKRLGKVEFRMDEIIIPGLKKVTDFVDENKGGITTASLLNSKIITVVITAIVAGAIILAATKGGF